ncbi:hypothetical protein DL96DRAFT_857133 [Flagelloscypha sp. PMI_526]|nr:hypothetical protein DL96DRAFT_857133 [Flagelloscypha sp. PMI_526]
MTPLPADLFPLILRLLSRTQLEQCALVSSQMQHTAQTLLFSHWCFHDVSWYNQRWFLLSSRGRALAKYIRSITFFVYSINSRNSKFFSEFLGIVHRVVSLKIEASSINRSPNWNDIKPGIWDILSSNVSDELQSLIVHGVSGVSLQDVLVKCPHLRHIEFGRFSSGYIADEGLTSFPFRRPKFKSISFTGYTDNNHALASFLKDAEHGIEDLYFGNFAPYLFQLCFQPLYLLSETLTHLSFDSSLCAWVSHHKDPELLPLSTLVRLQIMTFGACSPGIPQTPSLHFTPRSTDEAYPFYLWISRLIQEEGLPLSFTTFRFSIIIDQTPSIVIRHTELDDLAHTIRSKVDLSFEFNYQPVYEGFSCPVGVVERYLPTWKELGRLKIRIVQTYKYAEDETYWES